MLLHDLGQVKAISREQRIELSKLIVYLSAGAHEQTVEQWTKMGMKTRDMNPWVLEKHAEIAFNRDDRELCEGLNLQVIEVTCILYVVMCTWLNVNVNVVRWVGY